MRHPRLIVTLSLGIEDSITMFVTISGTPVVTALGASRGSAGTPSPANNGPLGQQLVNYWIIISAQLIHARFGGELSTIAHPS